MATKDTIIEFAVPANGDIAAYAVEAWAVSISRALEITPGSADRFTAVSGNRVYRCTFLVDVVAAFWDGRRNLNLRIRETIPPIIFESRIDNISVARDGINMIVAVGNLDRTYPVPDL